MSPVPRPTRTVRRALLGAVAALLALAAFEAARWRPLPEGPPPAREDRPAAGYERAAGRAREIVETFLASTPTAGLAVACAGPDGSPVWRLAAGHADLADRRPLTGDEPLRIGSVSKPLTAAILVRLAESGRMDLDRPVADHVDGLPPHLRPLTPRRLVTHTGGVRHYRWRMGWPPHETASRSSYGSSLEATAVFRDSPLLFPPGTGFHYSSHGYTLLAAAMEGATGRSFGELLATELAEPGGLEATELDGSPGGSAGQYTILGSWFRPAPRIDSSRSWAAGGLRSTAADLARFASLLAAGELVSPRGTRAIFTEQRLADGRGNPQGYGLGWRMADTERFLGGRRSYRVAHHGGVAAGGSAFLALFVDLRLAVAVVANSGTGSGALADLAFDLAEPFVAAAEGLEPAAAQRAGGGDPGRAPTGSPSS